MDIFKKTDFSKLKKYIEQSIDQFDMISYERKNNLKSLSVDIKHYSLSSNYANLNFICTHNSRRSHLSQLWAQTAAHYYNVENVYCFSGGTEATEFNRNAIDAIERAGFTSLKITNSLNPTYHVFYTNNNFSTHYSKIYYEPSKSQYKLYCSDDMWRLQMKVVRLLMDVQKKFPCSMKIQKSLTAQLKKISHMMIDVEKLVVSYFLLFLYSSKQNQLLKIIYLRRHDPLYYQVLWHLFPA